MQPVSEVDPGLPRWVRPAMVAMAVTIIALTVGILTLPAVWFFHITRPYMVNYLRYFLWAPLLMPLATLAVALRYNFDLKWREPQMLALGWPARLLFLVTGRVFFTILTGALQLTVFVFVFSFVHWATSVLNSEAFTESLTRMDALYFTLTTFTTTGFGDISPLSPTARAYVSLQVALGFVLVSALFTLFITRVGGWLLRPEVDEEQ